MCFGLSSKAYKRSKQPTRDVFIQKIYTIKSKEQSAENDKIQAHNDQNDFRKKLKRKNKNLAFVVRKIRSGDDLHAKAEGGPYENNMVFGKEFRGGRFFHPGSVWDGTFDAADTATQTQTGRTRTDADS
jgi:hypothetical protein